VSRLSGSSNAIVSHIAESHRKARCAALGPRNVPSPLIKERRAAAHRRRPWTGQNRRSELQRESHSTEARQSSRGLRRPSSDSNRDFNLVVGVNGVGKTSVLDALGVWPLCSRQAAPNRVGTQIGAFRRLTTSVSELTQLSVECGVQIGATEHSYLIHKPRAASYVTREGRQACRREQVHDTPEKASFFRSLHPASVTGREAGGPSAGCSVFRPTEQCRRSGHLEKSTAAGRDGVGLSADAFCLSRAFGLASLQRGCASRGALRPERPVAGRALAAFQEAVGTVSFRGTRTCEAVGKDRPEAG